MNWLYDAHIHLSDPEYEMEVPIITKSMEKLNIKACCVSMDNSNSKKTLDLAEQNKLILPFIGIHPEKANDDLDSMTNLIIQNKQKISGIGEIGLDKTYVSSEEEFLRQKKVFETQLNLAEKIHKPVSVHSRKTLNEIYEIMPSFNIKKVLLHWFDGNKKQLEKAMDMDFYVSYGPLLVYANDKQNLLLRTDVDKILVETDGPVKFSRCFGHKTAQISFIPSIVFCASKILRKTYSDFSLILEENSKRFLGI